MSKRVPAPLLVLLIAASPSLAASRAEEELRALVPKIVRAWESLDIAKVEPYYAADSGLAYFDVAPLKYESWADYRAGVEKLVFEHHRNLKIAPNDDLRIHPRGNFAWATFTFGADLETKAGQHSHLDGRWTMVLERRKEGWVVTHEHVSAPLPGTGSTEEQMAAYLRTYAAPGEHHKHLEMLAGTWTTEVKFWPAPGAPAMESTGRAEHRMILGGRYLETAYEGSFANMSFSGRGTAAYDRYLGKYVETWVDNFGTMVLVSEGSCDGTGKVRTLLASYVDPMTQKPTTLRSVYRIPDADHYVLEMYTRAGEAPEFKTMEIAHTRAR